jgi:hypothetical protein
MFSRSGWRRSWQCSVCLLGPLARENSRKTFAIGESRPMVLTDLFSARLSSPTNVFRSCDLANRERGGWRTTALGAATGGKCHSERGRRRDRAKNPCIKNTEPSTVILPPLRGIGMTGPKILRRRQAETKRHPLDLSQVAGAERPNCKNEGENQIEGAISNHGETRH